MTIENLTINWLARYAGINDCFSQNNVNYIDPDGIPRIGSTADVVNAFYVAHLIGKDDVIIISNTNYSQIKVINKNQDITLKDLGTVYAIENYCYIDCLEVVCENICIGTDLYSQKCVNGECITDQLIEQNSLSCGYIPPDPCENVICENICIGTDLYSQKCVNGECITDQLLESNSLSCSFEKVSKFPFFLGLGGVLVWLLSQDKENNK